MSVVRSFVETSISFPISSTTNLTGRINPRTTLVCLEQPTLASSKNRYNLNRINLDLTELQRVHRILSVLLDLAGYQSTLDQQTGQRASAMLIFLTRSTMKTLSLTSRRKKNLPMRQNYAASKRLHATEVFSF